MRPRSMDHHAEEPSRLAKTAIPPANTDSDEEEPVLAPNGVGSAWYV